MTITRNTVILAAVLLLIVGIFCWKLCQGNAGALRSHALLTALATLPDTTSAAKQHVADLIAANFTETRRIAANWSGLYWGLTFFAAVASAAAGLVMKWETSSDQEKRKKNWGATLAVIGALSVTVSTSGDFQRKWQANRMAAAQIESIGYDLLAEKGDDFSGYYKRLRDVLNDRQMAIAGTRENVPE